jgi:hypothetical protein
MRLKLSAEVYLTSNFHPDRSIVPVPESSIVIFLPSAISIISGERLFHNVFDQGFAFTLSLLEPESR